MSKLVFPAAKSPEDFESKDFNKKELFFSEKERIKFEEKRLVAAERPQRSRIFKSEFLERLTLIRWYTPFFFWTPIVIYLFYRNITQYHLSLLSTVIVLFSGVLLWTLAEYLIHRYLFHYNCKSIWGKKMVYTIHGNHHDDPNDPLRGVMPLPPAVVYAGILYGLFYLMIPIWFLDIFFASFLIGYLMYDGIHYYTHHAKPKSRLGKYLRRYHLVHHVHADIVFGISSPLWDYVFRTYRKKDYSTPKNF